MKKNGRYQISVLQKLLFQETYATPVVIRQAVSKYIANEKVSSETKAHLGSYLSAAKENLRLVQKNQLSANITLQANISESI